MYEGYLRNLKNRLNEKVNELESKANVAVSYSKILQGFIEIIES